MIQPDTPVRRSCDLLFSAVDDDWMAIHPEAGYGYSLNQMGHRIWGLLEKPMTVSEICCRLREDYDVEESVCLRQVGELIQQLEMAGLIQCEI